MTTRPYRPSARVALIDKTLANQLMTIPRLAQLPSERRSYQRLDVDYLAVARLADGTSISCRVKNISPMGALLEFPEARIMPANFRITIPSELFTAECEFRHQTGKYVGVLFTTGRMEALARFS